MPDKPSTVDARLHHASRFHSVFERLGPTSRATPWFAHANLFVVADMIVDWSWQPHMHELHSIHGLTSAAVWAHGRDPRNELAIMSPVHV